MDAVESLKKKNGIGSKVLQDQRCGRRLRTRFGAPPASASSAATYGQARSHCEI